MIAKGKEEHGESKVGGRVAMKKTRLIFWACAVFLAAMLALTMGFWLFSPQPVRSGITAPLNVDTAQPPNRRVIGDLGGMSVSIPDHFANYVEYEGDPGFGEKRQGPKPERTQASKLRSFGFHVRYPDMAGRSSPELWKAYNEKQLFTSQWVSVGITTGSYFGDGRFLERSVDHMSHDSGGFQYPTKPAHQYGLDVYSPINADVSLRKMDKNHVYRSDPNDEDQFVHRNASGQVDALIKCSNRQHDGAPCQHYFFLPSPLKAKITLLYRRGLLPQWQQIQTSIQTLIMGFSAPPYAAVDH